MKESNIKVVKDTVKQKLSKKSKFPIVAIGGSAHSLGALEMFFVNLPLEPGMVFVVVQHLSPDSESILPDIIACNTKLAVNTVGEGMSIEPDNIYIIPPNKEMTLLDGNFHLEELPKARNQRWPINKFFTSLAECCKHKAIGLIFSGLGSDGSVGAKA